MGNVKCVATGRITKVEFSRAVVLVPLRCTVNTVRAHTVVASQHRKTRRSALGARAPGLPAGLALLCCSHPRSFPGDRRTSHNLYSFFPFAHLLVPHRGDKPTNPTHHYGICSFFDNSTTRCFSSSFFILLFSFSHSQLRIHTHTRPITHEPPHHCIDNASSAEAYTRRVDTHYGSGVGCIERVQRACSRQSHHDRRRQGDTSNFGQH